jgi:hypothetical protein
MFYRQRYLMHEIFYFSLSLAEVQLRVTQRNIYVLFLHV